MSDNKDKVDVVVLVVGFTMLTVSLVFLMVMAFMFSPVLGFILLGLLGLVLIGGVVGNG